MSNSALLKSSIAKKYWMALTGLFLCTFLLGHLLGNLQLLVPGEEGRRMFNEYAYFMTHNPAIKALSYLTYISILFHAIDGIALTIQNKKARPVAYAYSNPGANSSLPSRYMAILGTLILVFIATHMANFWWKMKFTEEIPLHTYKLESKQEMGASADQSFYYTHTPSLQPIPADPNSIDVKNKTELYYKGTNIKIGEGYKDLHTVVMTFFKDKSTGLFAVLFYTLSMLILGFHLWHGFASAFQSLGLNHAKWNGVIKITGRAFAVLIPLAFAIIPIIIFLNK
jgi:succinate dehydrogenase / fumarate reductase cytochrome b subunit